MEKTDALALRRFGAIAVLLGGLFIHAAAVHGAEPASMAGAYALTKGTNEFGV